MILLTGANGHLGANLLRRLLADGAAVRVLLRPDSDNSSVDGLGVERVFGDLSDPASLVAATTGVTFCRPGRPPCGRGRGMTLLADDLGFVGARPLVGGPADVTFSLAPGDRPLVTAGESVVAGAPIAERLRDPQLIDVPDTVTLKPVPGGRVPAGELLFDWRGRWRVASGETTESLETPMAGIVRSVRPGTSIVIQATGRSLAGIVTLGGPTRGRLHVSANSDGELRAGGLDVGLAGTILVVGSRIDAETLTRSRAMGIRGIASRAWRARNGATSWPRSSASAPRSTACRRTRSSSSMAPSAARCRAR